MGRTYMMSLKPNWSLSKLMSISSGDLFAKADG